MTPTNVLEKSSNEQNQVGFKVLLNSYVKVALLLLQDCLISGRLSNNNCLTTYSGFQLMGALWYFGVCGQNFPAGDGNNLMARKRFVGPFLAMFRLLSY